METRTETAHSPNIRGVGSALKWVGWLSLWLQLAFAVGGSLCLLFALSGRRFNSETTPGTGIGMFWAVCAIVTLLFGVFLCLRYARFGQRLRASDPNRHPRKSETAQLLRLGVLTALAGILLSILGVGSTLGLLLSKAVAQPQGVAIYDPNRIIRALDVLVGLANANALTGHFIGVATALWMADRVDRA